MSAAMNFIFECEDGHYWKGDGRMRGLITKCQSDGVSSVPEGDSKETLSETSGTAETSTETYKIITPKCKICRFTDTFKAKGNNYICLTQDCDKDFYLFQCPEGHYFSINKNMKNCNSVECRQCKTMERMCSLTRYNIEVYSHCIYNTPSTILRFKCHLCKRDFFGNLYVMTKLLNGKLRNAPHFMSCKSRHWWGTDKKQRSVLRTRRMFEICHDAPCDGFIRERPHLEATCCNESEGIMVMHQSDSLYTEERHEMIKKYCKTAGITYIVIPEDQVSLEEICQYYVKMLIRNDKFSGDIDEAVGNIIMMYKSLLDDDKLIKNYCDFV